MLYVPSRGRKKTTCSMFMSNGGGRGKKYHFCFNDFSFIDIAVNRVIAYGEHCAIDECVKNKTLLITGMNKVVLSMLLPPL